MRKALGRGLDALIPGAGVTAPRPAPSAPLDAPGAGDREVSIDRVHANSRQPRREFDEHSLAELADSIRTQGILQPLLVRPIGDDQYEIVAGERRFRAAQRAGLREVPVVVRELTDTESLEIALVENIQRDDLSPLDEATAYQRLIDEFGHTQDAVAERVGKSRPAVANALRLLRLPDAVKQELSRGRLTAGHARVLVSIEGADAQLRAMRQILARELSVREAEQIGAAKRKAAGRTKGKTGTVDPHRQSLERTLTTSLGTRVRIHPRGKKGGVIEIEYYTDDQLDGLIDRLG
jgi:ParB family chromosome partitioning protein